MRWKLGKHDAKTHILDYAKDDNNRDNDQFIDELKQAIRACRVFAFYPFYWVCYNQLIGNLTSQAAQMNVGKTCDTFPAIANLFFEVHCRTTSCRTSIHWS